MTMPVNKPQWINGERVAMTDGGVDVHDNAQTITIDAHTIAETVWNVALDRSEGRDGRRWVDADGRVLREERTDGLKSLDELVDVNDLMTGHPLPLRQDDDFEEIREIVVGCLESDLRGDVETLGATDVAVVFVDE